MALNLHNLKPARGSKQKYVRVGRGTSSGHGTYSGRGAKGQRARSGGKGGLKLMGLRRLIQSTPKYKGFQSLKPKFQVVNLSDLEKNFQDNDLVTTASLLAKGLITGKEVGVKILGDGKLTKKLTLKVQAISKSAKAMVEKNKGQVIIFGKAKAKAAEEKS